MTITRSPLRIIVISDAHLMKSETDRLFEVNTREATREVVEWIKNREQHADLAIFAGDISQDGSEESYRYAMNLLQDLPWPVIWMKGNHDDFTPLDPDLRDRLLVRSFHSLPWHIIFLDTAVKGSDEGLLGREEQKRLEEFMRQHWREHVFIFMHHPPVEVGSGFMDRLKLQNSQDFWNLLAGQHPVRGILFGHVHQEYDRVVEGIRVLSVPSTSIQFKPFSGELTFDSLANGYRILTLEPDGSFETSVRRVGS